MERKKGIMVEYELNITDEVRNVIKDLAMQDKNYQKRLHSGKVVFAILGAFCCFLGLFYVGVVKNVVFGGILFVIAAFCFCYGFIVLNRLYRRNLDKVASSANKVMLTGKRNYTFDADGVKIVSDIGDGLSKWNAFTEWGNYSHYLYLKRMDGAWVLVDQNDISKEKLQEIKNLLGSMTQMA